MDYDNLESKKHQHQNILKADQELNSNGKRTECTSEYMSTQNSNDKFEGREENKNHLALASSYCSIFCVSLIILVKMIGWLKTDSVSILASLVDAILDSISSLINLVALKYALQPPDDEHRFGHNKAEDLAGFTQSAFFGASGIFLMGSCIHRIFSPKPFLSDHIGIIVMVISIILTLLLVMFQTYVLRNTSSKIVEADHIHYKTDLLLNITVIISIFAQQYFATSIFDPLLGSLISIYIISESWKLLKKSFKNLMDEEFEESQKQKIINIIENHPKVISMHHLKTRYAGSKPFIQFHLVMNGDISLNEAHDLSEEIENKLLEIFPDAEILIHQDPEHCHH